MIEYVVNFLSNEINDFVLHERIVRCKDCKYADETESGLLFCTGYLVESWDWYNDLPSDGVKVKPNGYCAWGERKERIER